MELTLPQIEGKVREFTCIINAPEDLIPTFGYSKESGLPHIEIYNETYYLLVSENGNQLSKKSTTDPDELLFMIMHTVSMSMACERMALQIGNESFRLRFFQAQKNIMSKINLSYASRVKLKSEAMQSELLVL